VTSTTATTQIRMAKASAAYWRVTFDNPPLNLMGPQFVLEFRKVMAELEADEQVQVGSVKNLGQPACLSRADRPG
jgi:enoyl-CoA hydratase/carnithine racemase